MRLPRGRPDIEVSAGERVLAWTLSTDDELLAGTREALYLPGVRLPWEDVESASWNDEDRLLRVVEVGTWGELRREHTFALGDPARFLGLVRERVTASVVLVRHVPISGRRGLRVIARRGASGDRPLRWVYEFDAGIDPDDPTVRLAAETALEAAQEEVGPQP